jgi:hypothetical protein
MPAFSLIGVSDMSVLGRPSKYLAVYINRGQIIGLNKKPHMLCGDWDEKSCRPYIDVVFLLQTNRNVLWNKHI